jgi:hypothetical protein
MRVSARSISRCVAALLVLMLLCPLVLAQPRQPFQQPVPPRVEETGLQR